jgi:hypothetical protein
VPAQILQPFALTRERVIFVIALEFDDSRIRGRLELQPEDGTAEAAFQGLKGSAGHVLSEPVAEQTRSLFSR